MRIIPILLFLLIGVLGFGQGIPEVVPPSPEATQLAKFVDMPVSLYSGTANVSIPFYTINSGGIQIPISISYHSKGIQVGEKASRVGLGWVLNAGGAITRQVRGKVDEFGYGYYNQNYASDFTTNASKRAELYFQGLYGFEVADYYPDLFTFNFLGYSGKFIIDHVTKQPVLQSYSDLKIQKNGFGGQAFNDFIITTPDGTKFYFGFYTKDITYVRNSYRYSDSSQGFEALNHPNSNYIDTWYLEKIVTTTNEEIDFSYQIEEVYYNDVDEINRDNNSKFLTYSTTHAFQNQLKQIIFNDGKVVFNATGERQDLKGGKTLNEIQIYAKKDFQANTFDLNKRFRFNYYYTTSNDNNLETVFPFLKLGNTNPQNITYYDTKRLFLDYIEEINPLNSNEKIITSFEYNPVLLPNRLSNAADNWGYYNAKNNHYLDVFLETDRTVSELYSEAGILKKINHPTGGSTEFVYEQNRVILQDFFKDLFIAYNNPFTPKTAGLFKNPNLYDSARNSYYQSFVVGRKSIINFNVLFDTQDCTVGGPAEETCKYDVFITDESGVTPLHRLVLGNENSVELFSGNYKIRVIPKYSGHDPEDYEQYPFQVYGNWQEQDITDDQELMAAGKRIKEIIKRDTTGITLQKKFYYTDEQGKCSGKTFSIPAFFHKIIGGQYTMGNYTLNGGFGPAKNFTGNNLGYSVVTEIQIGNGNNGKTISTFTDYENGGEYYRLPYNVPIDFEWARGLPREIKEYKYENGNYVLLKRVLNNYTFYDQCGAPGGNLDECFEDPNNPTPPTPDYFVNKIRAKIPIYLFSGYLSNTPPYQSSCDITSSDCYRTSYFIGGKFNLSQKEEFNYFDSGLVYSKTNYNHNSNNHLQLTNQTTTNSAGEMLETKYSYAPDISNTINDSLVSKNIVGIPLKTEIKRNGELLSTQETIYKDWGNNLFAPEIIKTAKGTNTAEVRVKYNLVDNSNGNPLEVQQESGIPISYIWGYNKTKPVAKLENVAYASIPSSHIQAIETASNSNNEADLKTALTALRNDTSLANAMITTFTYKPLVGVSSVTDPKGNTTTYHYDNFGRLEFVKDKDDNILSETKYHYRTQN